MAAAPVKGLIPVYGQLLPAKIHLIKGSVLCRIRIL